jgi:hypothetical protein
MKELPPDEDCRDEEWANEGDGNDDILRACPSCKRQIHGEAERCPFCGDYVVDEDAPRRRLPVWMIVGALLAFLVLAAWALRR